MRCHGWMEVMRAEMELEAKDSAEPGEVVGLPATAPVQPGKPGRVESLHLPHVFPNMAISRASLVRDGELLEVRPRIGPPWGDSVVASLKPTLAGRFSRRFTLGKAGGAVSLLPQGAWDCGGEVEMLEAGSWGKVAAHQVPFPRKCLGNIPGLRCRLEPNTSHASSLQVCTST